MVKAESITDIPCPAVGNHSSPLRDISKIKRLQIEMNNYHHYQGVQITLIPLNLS